MRLLKDRKASKLQIYKLPDHLLFASQRIVDKLGQMSLEVPAGIVCSLRQNDIIGQGLFLPNYISCYILCIIASPNSEHDTFLASDTSLARS